MDFLSNYELIRGAGLSAALLLIRKTQVLYLDSSLLFKKLIKREPEQRKLVLNRERVVPVIHYLSTDKKSTAKEAIGRDAHFRPAKQICQTGS